MKTLPEIKELVETLKKTVYPSTKRKYIRMGIGSIGKKYGYDIEFVYNPLNIKIINKKCIDVVWHDKQNNIRHMFKIVEKFSLLSIQLFQFMSDDPSIFKYYLVIPMPDTPNPRYIHSNYVSQSKYIKNCKVFYIKRRIPKKKK